jgi:hypothetical protein
MTDSEDGRNVSDDRCPICGGMLTTYKSQRVGRFVRRLRRCKEREKCGYKEVIVVQVKELILQRTPMLG